MDSHIPTVVLLSGKQGSGKSSIQSELVRLWIEYQQNQNTLYFVCKPNFADILYEMHNAVLGILHKYIPARDIKKDGYLLQLLGTEWGRNTIDDNVWVTTLKSSMKMDTQLFSERISLFVIGDCRFENEFDAFPDSDFPNVLKVRLEASEEIRKSRCSMWRSNTSHISEIGLDDYAKKGLFDLYLNTENTSKNVNAEKILDRLK